MPGPGAGAPDDRSLQELWSEMGREVGSLVRNEVELAKVEIKDTVSRAAQAGAMFTGTGVAAFFALQALSLAAAFGLAVVLPTGVAFLMVGVVYVVVAGLLFAQGRKRLAAVRPPTQTVQTLKEDVRLAKSSLARGANAPLRQEWYPTTPWSQNSKEELA